MPTLLQINVCVNHGSTGRIAEQIGELVISRGWESYIAYGRGCAHSSSHIIKVGSRIGVWLHALLTRITDKHGLFSRLATKKLIRKISAISPDIIHLHNIHGYYVNYKILFEYLRKEDIPVVWTLHDCWPMTGHCTHFEAAKCDKWRKGCYDCPEKFAYPRSLLFDCSRRNYLEKRESFTSIKRLTLVPVSNWLSGIIKSSYLKGYDVEVINNGVDINIFRPILDNDIRERYGISSDKKIILAVASIWSRRKGYDDIIQLSSILDKERYQIVMVGLSDSALSVLPEGVMGLSRTNSTEELAMWYSAADVFVNPTYEDTYPTTNLEALSCGTPVVTYDAGGSPESLTLAVGRVVDVGDLITLARAIVELCDYDRGEMRKYCYEYAVANFDKQECFKKYIELYEKLINNNI